MDIIQIADLMYLALECGNDFLQMGAADDTPGTCCDNQEGSTGHQEQAGNHWVVGENGSEHDGFVWFDDPKVARCGGGMLAAW